MEQIKQFDYERAFMEIFSAGLTCPGSCEDLIDLIESKFPDAHDILMALRCKLVADRYNLMQVLGKKKIPKYLSQYLESIDWSDYFDKYFRSYVKEDNSEE